MRAPIWMDAVVVEEGLGAIENYPPCAIQKYPLGVLEQVAYVMPISVDRAVPEVTIDVHRPAPEARAIREEMEVLARATGCSSAGGSRGSVIRPYVFNISALRE